MAKGMNLDEFKNALSSEATIENKRLEKELATLYKSTSKQIKELTEECNTYKNQCKILGNRCFVFTQGSMCLYCNIESCEYLPSEGNIMSAIDYMLKNNMPRNDKTREKINSFIMERNNK